MVDLALDDRVFINDTLDAYIQEIDILFGTSRTELLGSPEYGSNYMEFLWKFNPDIERLITYTEGLLGQCYYSKMYSTEVSAEILKGDLRDIYLLGIKIYYKNKLQKSKLYQFR